ncbi:MAG TPA: DUF423 domain-containing protein [Longimicrobiales bacterium]|nr:DUF423 domain-containing protein [Longimicrobiales bacterium]
MDRVFFALGAILGALGVAAGAFGTHSLSGRLAADRLELFELATRYQLTHALALLAVGYAVYRWPSNLAVASGWLMVAGVLVFCGTIYALAFGAPRILGAVTPIGGLSLIIGWVLLAAAALRARA